MRKLNNKSHIIASVGTLVLAALLFLFLWFYLIYITTEQEVLEEGVEIAFAEPEEPAYQVPFDASEGEEGASAAAGEPEPAPQIPPAQTNPDQTPRPVQPQEPTRPPITQTTPSPVKQEPDPKVDAEAKAAEEARLKAEAAAKAKAEAEAKARAEAEARAQKMGSLFGQGNGGAGGTGGQSSAGNGGAGDNPAKGKGSGKSGNGSWKLEGRDIVGTLPQPEKGKYEPGKVVIEIRVNPEGRVVSAKVTTGTNVSDKATIEVMLLKAREARFTPSEQKQDQIGLITYIIPT
ncbi:MAG: hypothetical protein II551_00955 [Paludibacteraceae bacterium]|nr:hypothetical protein [Paludibacteraceae bacterium]